jgi:1-acyl-sn-glycerol-3-phosphate acyltransferase
VIFPEGTRSNSAKPSAFRIGGLKQLVDAMPDAKLVGITINNSWKLSRYGYFPMGVGAKITLKMHPPMDCPSDQVAETLEQLEKTITAAINP